MDYYFSTVTGLLPPATQSIVLPSCLSKRPYVPRAARPHVAWSVEASSPLCMGRLNRLRGDGTATRATENVEGEREGSGSNLLSGSRTTLGLQQLMTIDATEGKRVVTYYADQTNDKSGGDVGIACTESSCIPSNRRIVSLLCASGTRSGCEATTSAVGDGPALTSSTYVSDDMGNVYLLHWPQRVASHDAAGEDDMTRKRARVEGNEAGTATVSVSNRWEVVQPAHSPLPSTIVAAAGECSPFAVAHGAPGWAGLCQLSLSGATETLISAREFFNDVRVVDVATSTVVRTYSTTHSPTAVDVPPGQCNCVLVTEGCLATLFDVRCPSAVISMATALAFARAATAPRGEEAPEGSAVQASTTETVVPLVPGRLTSTMGDIRDVCHTANPNEVALCIERSLCVYDYRKFTRLFSSANVLKFAIASIAACGEGRAVVCAGIDAEVRLFPLQPKSASGPPPPPLTGSKGGVPSASDPQAPAPDDPSRSTFRTRLNSSVSCESTWQGGWVTAVNAGGRVAVGVSSDNEVFLAQ